MTPWIERLLPNLATDESSNPGLVINSIGYTTALAGYIFTILASSPLTWSLFLLFTAANLLWFACYTLLTRYSDHLTQTQVHLVLLGLAVATLWTDALMFAGLSLDWLLPIVTIIVYILVYSTGLSLVISLGIALATMVMAGVADTVLGAHPGLVLQNEITLAPAFLFAFTFPLLMRQQRRQREHAETLVAELETAQAQLRAHADQVEELAVARERNRLAREIHDTLGHYLTILAVQLETALKLEEHADPRLHHELVEARRVAAECLAEVRQSVSALRPTDLTRTTLSQALARLVREFEAVLPEAELVFDAEENIDALAPEIRVALYRCTQEALTNVRKHARATKVLVRLRVDAGQVELTVLDNGQHAHDATAETPWGFGLQGIRERIELLGGSVLVGSEPTAGWRVEVRLPVALSDHPADELRPATAAVSGVSTMGAEQ